jgi:hypothetical protein
MKNTLILFVLLASFATLKAQSTEPTPPMLQEMQPNTAPAPKATSAEVNQNQPKLEAGVPARRAAPGTSAQPPATLKEQEKNLQPKALPDDKE